MKKLIALVLAAVLCLGGAVTAFAADNDIMAVTSVGPEVILPAPIAGLSSAQQLYDLGLVSGAGTNADGTVDFNLGAKTTREEAVVMLIKLMGQVDEAIASKSACPFTDVAAWAAPYVGYAQAKGIVNGASATSFNAKADIAANEFATLILNALGKTVDWQNPWDEAKKVGLVAAEPTGDFTRAAMMDIALAAVKAEGGKLANTTTTTNGKATADAANAGYKIPKGTMKALHEDGKKYIYTPTTMYLVPGYVRAYLDDYEFILAVAPTEVDAKGGDLYVALSDIAKMYGPDFKVTEENGTYTLKHAGLTVKIALNSAKATGDNGEFTLAGKVKKDVMTGEVMVPAITLLHYGFGKSTGSLQNQEVWDTSKGGYENGKYDYLKYVRNKNTTIYAVSNAEVQLENNTSAYSGLSVLKNKLRGAKDYGIRYIAFYDADPRVDECLVAELYVPTCLYFHPEKAVPAVIVFPGANGSAGSFNSASTADIMQNLQPYAEEHGYLLICIESWTMSAQYGDPTGPIGRFEVTNNDPSHNNPWNKSQLWLDAIQTDGDINIHYLEYVESIYNIDKNRVYAYGNSMGAMGAWSMAINYPEYVNAVCGSAGITEIDFWPEDKNVYEHTKAPYLFIGGTEDPNGLDFLLYGAEKLTKKLGPSLFQYKLVGGATHGTEWKFNPELIFDWFDAHPTHVKY